jgi:hypothetical protein
VEALPRQHREFDFSHIKPAPVLGRVMDLELFHKAPRLGRRKRLVERGGRVRIQIVHHDDELLRVAIRAVAQVADEMGEVDPQGYMDQRSAAEEPRESAKGADGVERTHRRAGCERPLETVFGEVTVSRIGYGYRGYDSVFPLDAALNLPPGKYSHGLQGLLSNETAKGAFEEAVATIGKMTGGHVPKRQAEELTPKMAVDFDAFYAKRRDPEQERQWCVLVDGAEHQLEQIKKLVKRHGVTVIIIMDLIHVLEYLWDAAHCFFKVGDEAAEQWVGERALEILRGNAGQVAGGIRRKATKLNLDKAKRKNADKCANYLLKHKKYLRYDEYLAEGFPIATGVIEGACRYLVKDRMDLTGARWGLDNAEAVLKLRALRASGDLDEYWDFHRAEELKRHHRSRYAIYPRLEVMK